MSATAYNRAIGYVLDHEGGYVNHKSDPGGPTNKGVTQRVYDAYRRNIGRPIQSVKAITMEEVHDIYRRQYWNRVRGDDLPTGLDYAVFDYAVNSGVSRAVKDLQRSLASLGAKPGKVDGVIGENTLKAIRSVSTAAIIQNLCERRLDFVKRLSTWSVFGKGWTRRIVGEHEGAQQNGIGVLDRAMLMAVNTPTNLVARPIGANAGEIAGKADPEDISTKATPEAVGGGIAGIGTIGSVLLEYVPVLQQFGDHWLVQVSLACVVMAGLGLTVYSAFENRKEANV